MTTTLCAQAICLLTDHVTSSDTATFQVGERSRSIYPAGLLTQTLADAVGAEAATNLYLTEAKMTGLQACELGLCQASSSNAQRLACSLARRYALSVGEATGELHADLRALSGELPPSDRRVLAVAAFAQARCMQPRALGTIVDRVAFTCSEEILTRGTLRRKVQAALCAAGATPDHGQLTTPPEWTEVRYASQDGEPSGSAQSVLTQLLQRLAGHQQEVVSHHDGAEAEASVEEQRVDVAPLAADFADALTRHPGACPLEALMAAYDSVARVTAQSDATAREESEPSVVNDACPCLLLLRHASAAVSSHPLIIAHSLLGDHKGYGRLWNMALEQSDVYVVQWPNSKLPWEFYRNMLPDVPLVLCHGCNHFFHEEDWEVALMQEDVCPFCRMTVKPSQANGAATHFPEDAPALVAPKLPERIETMRFDCAAGVPQQDRMTQSRRGLTVAHAWWRFRYRALAITLPPEPDGLAVIAHPLEEVPYERALRNGFRITDHR